MMGSAVSQGNEERILPAADAAAGNMLCIDTNTGKLRDQTSAIGETPYNGGRV